MNSLLQDVRFGLRVLWNRPGFTAVALAVLALGVGANTAIFSVVNAVLIRPLPYPGAERVIAFDAVNPPKGITESNMSAPDFVDWKAQSRSFEALAIYATGDVNMTGGDEPERIGAAAVSGDFFRAIGAQPARGRAVLPEDTEFGRERVGVISHGLWQRSFGADPAAVGRRLEVGGQSVEIIGVMPASYDFPQRTDVWFPLKLDVSKDSRDNRSYSGRRSETTIVCRAAA